MAKTGITEYDLLISCPGDVEKFISYMEDAVKKFNSLYGREHGIRVQTRYWPQDCYSQMGDTPQNILNRQFIKECDMTVAVFWTKFGKQTDKNGSGTAEEIQTMIDAGKQVFLYFLDKHILPSQIDSDFMKVREFREWSRQRGLCFDVEDERVLKYNFFEDLIAFFSEEMRRKKEKLPVKNISAVLTEQNIWLAADRGTIIGNLDVSHLEGGVLKVNR